jgi:co-chaperonin GroES (HSP10)
MSKVNLAQAIDLSAVLNQPEEPKEPEKVSVAQLPAPTGYHILCAVPEAEEKYESGILKDSTTKRIEENGTVVLFVLKLGDMCYKDEDKFPTGPWCQEGDFVLTRAYAGTRFKIHGREFRIINDDTVEGVVLDPRGYSRA